MSGEIADPGEVLRTLTRIMRGDEDAPRGELGERRRAAELLARRYGLLAPDPREAGKARRQAVAAVEAAVAAMRRALEAGEEAEATSDTTGTPCSG